AAKWLNQYGTLDELVRNADSIKGVLGENLRAAIPNFELTRKLVTVKLDCELPEIAGDLESLVPPQQDKEALIRLYEDYGFRTWVRDLTGDPQRIPEQDARVMVKSASAETNEGAPPAAVEANYEVVLDWEAFDQWMERLRTAPLVALDTETTSLDPMEA